MYVYTLKKNYFNIFTLFSDEVAFDVHKPIQVQEMEVGQTQKGVFKVISLLIF